MKITSITTTFAAMVLAGCPSATPMDADESSETGSESSTTAIVQTTTSEPADSTTSADPTTDAGDSTTSPVDDSTTSSTTTAESSTGEDSTTGDPPPKGGYGDCVNEPNLCRLANKECIDGGFAGVCALPCGDVDECPAAPLTGDAPVSCIDVSGRGQPECILNCSAGGETCPDGMFCLPLSGGYRLCAWPADPIGDGVCPDAVLDEDLPTSFAGSTTGLGDDFFSLCGFQGGDDALIEFAAPRDGLYTISTIDPGTAFDTVISVLDGGCGGPPIACNDDAGMVGGPSEVMVDLIAGQTVVVGIDGYYPSDNGAFVLNVSVQ
jgi:hypothetical protein